MTVSQILAQMKDTIFEVFDAMLFLPVAIDETHTDAAAWLPEEDLLCARMTFSGPHRGEFFFLVPRPLGVELAANFLGLEAEEISPQMSDDTIKEALNMVGGRSLSLLDRKAEYSLGIPAMANDRPEWASLCEEKATGCLCLKSDANHLLFAVSLD